MYDQYKVVCANCKIEAEIFTDVHKVTAVCPGCRQRDNAEDAQLIAAEHFVEGFAKELQSTIRDGIKRSRFIQFDGRPVPQRPYRWHALVGDRR